MIDQNKLNSVYTERTALAVALAKTIITHGGQAGIGLDDKLDSDIEWRVVLYVDTPVGQLSWHIAPDDQWLLKGLPTYPGKWDGTFRARNTEYALNWGSK